MGFDFDFTLDEWIERKMRKIGGEDAEWCQALAGKVV